MGARQGTPASGDAAPATGGGNVHRIEPRTETVRDLLTPPGRRRRIAGYVVAVAANALAIAALLPLRSELSLHSIGFTFLIVAVISAAVGGFGPGLVGSLIAFASFNFLFIPPYGTFAIREGEDVIALFVFLGISLTISVLLARTRQRADAAEERERELLALQRLSSDLVGMGPGAETYEALLTRVVRLFGFQAGGAVRPGGRRPRSRPPGRGRGAGGGGPPGVGPAVARAAPDPPAAERGAAAPGLGGPAWRPVAALGRGEPDPALLLRSARPRPGA
jgi:two-component system sensor histidine kinase KdpD